MSDLMSKLNMRRKGISGTRVAAEDRAPEVRGGVGGGGAMEKISMMIPPPPPATGEDQDQDQGDDDDDLDDWD